MKKKRDYKFMLVMIYIIKKVLRKVIVVMCRQYFVIYFLVFSRKSFILLKFYDYINFNIRNV